MGRLVRADESARRELRVPRRIENRPHELAPLGGTLALLLALEDQHLAAVYTHQGLASYQDVLQSPFVYLPLADVVPGLLNVADVDDVAAALAPSPLAIDSPLDGAARPLSGDAAKAAFPLAQKAYAAAKATDALALGTDHASPATWLAEQLGR